MRVSRRTLSSFVSTGLLVAIVAVVFGLDWKAALWADGFDAPVSPPGDREFSFEVVEVVQP